MGAAMRMFFILPLSAFMLAGCLTTQESPIYEQSTSYKGDLAARHQYANAVPATPAPTVVSYESAPAQPLQTQPYPAQMQAAPIQAATIQAYSPTETVMATAPTDEIYGATQVTGTPGFMAMQNAAQAGTVQAAAQPFHETQFVDSAPLGAAGTPIAYDYRRNLVSVDAETTEQRLPESFRLVQEAGQRYAVQQGDTVYSLSRKTCVGVNVIQSMNELDSNYAIKIGQSILLPASVC